MLFSHSVWQDAFKGMVNLRSLTLWGNLIQDFHPDTFKDTKNLEYVCWPRSASPYYLYYHPS